MTLAQDVATLQNKLATVEQQLLRRASDNTSLTRQALDSALTHIRTHKDVLVVTATPTHVAVEPTLAWDKTNDKFYINSGGSTWILIGGLGISTHDILDGLTHQDSVADGVTRGSIVIGNSTPKWDELVVGAAGKVLTSDGTDITWNNPGGFGLTTMVESPTASEDISIAYFFAACTVQEIQAVVVGSSTPSVTIEPSHSTDRSAAGNDVLSAATAITSTTTGQNLTSFDDATIPTDSFLWLDTTAQSGTVTSLLVVMRLTWD